MAYNSELTGLSVDERLRKVVEAQPATDEEAGVGGLIPAPPAGSQTNKKILLSNMAWGDYVTKEYVDNATSAVKWKKQIVASLPSIGSANDQVIYLVKDNLASTDSRNVYNEYIVVTPNEGEPFFEALGMVDTGVDDKVIDYATFMSNTANVVTTLASLPVNSHSIIANVSAATSLSVASGMVETRELQIRVNNTTSSKITQILPNAGSYQSMSGTSVVIPGNRFIELSIWYIGGKYVIRVGEVY